jgi:hypothetical protein
MRLRYAPVFDAARRTAGPVPLAADMVRFAPTPADAEALAGVRAAEPVLPAVPFAPTASLDFVVVPGRLAVATGAVALAGALAADPLVPLALATGRAACVVRGALAERVDWAAGRRGAPLPFFAM